MTRIKDDELLKSLIDIILKTPVYLRLGEHTEMPYMAAPPELVPNPTKVEITTDGFLVLYNMLTEQFDEIHVDTIVSFNYCMDDDGVINPDPIHKRIQDDISEIRDCINSDMIQLSKLDVISRYCIYGQSYSEWSIVKYFHCKYTINQLREPSDELMLELRDHYMDLIRKHRVNSFTELDQLESDSKEQGCTDEDLQDIDTIKQMFRDIPQDIDLSSCKTIHDLEDAWPSLLTPKPKNFLQKHQLDMLTPEVSVPTNVFEIRDILSKSKNVSDIQALISELDGSRELDALIISEAKKRILCIRSDASKTLQNDT